MIRAGDLLLFRFPQTDQTTGKLRPAMVIKRIDNEFRDCLVCMISTRIQRRIEPLEPVIAPGERDFESSGLKKASLIRLSRLAVVDERIFEGKLGQIDQERLRDVVQRLSTWLLEA